MTTRLHSVFERQSWVRRAARFISGSLLSTMMVAVPAIAAERITAFYGPLQFSLSREALELYATQGKITPDLAFYTKRATPQQLAQFRTLLQQRIPVSPVLVSQVTHAPLGEAILQQLGTIVQTDAGQNGFYAMRAALILAAADPTGLTLLNALRYYPTPSVRLDLAPGLALAKDFAQKVKDRDAAIAAVQQTATAELAAQPAVDFSQPPDLRQPGSTRWQRQTFSLHDPSRDRTVPVDLYLPTSAAASTTHPSVPLVVILHGAASDRSTFAYIATQLASYGFAVAVPESPGNSSQRFQQFLAGRADPPDVAELVNQPLDVKRLLDDLQRRSQTDPLLRSLNLQQVGVMGHSQGGYAALALAGAPLNREQLQHDCSDHQSLNIPRLVQCQALELPPVPEDLRDDRVKAVLAVSPVTSSILGRAGLSQITVPVMLLAGSADIVTPALPEQIRPFTWLTTRDRYLALIENGTHFSPLGGSANDPGALRIPPAFAGPDPAIARTYLRALSVAFFQTYIANQTAYRPYLSAAYAGYLSQQPLRLSLIQSDQRLEALDHHQDAR